MKCELFSTVFGVIMIVDETGRGVMDELFVHTRRRYAKFLACFKN